MAPTDVLPHPEFQAGYLVGLEMAARACEAVEETEPAMFAHNAHAGVGLTKMLCAAIIRDLRANRQREMTSVKFETQQ